MPISYIDVPQGIRIDAKKKLVKEVYTALDEAYRIPDTRIFLREWALESVSQDGRLDSEPAKSNFSRTLQMWLRSTSSRDITGTC